MTFDISPAGRRVLIASEKPDMANLQAKAWKRAHPHDVLTFYYLTPLGRLSLDIPRDLPLSRVPQIAEPTWTENYVGDRITRAPDGCHLARVFATAAEQADLVVCGADWDHQGAFNFANIARDAGLVLDDTIPWWRIDSLAQDDLDASLADLATVTHPDFDALRRYGEARRHFDYNYALNALPCFSHVLRRAAAPLHANFISKNALQLLFHLVENDTPLTQGAILSLMKYWPGTGKYPAQQMGSPISKGQIIEDLLNARLLERHYPGTRASGAQPREHLAPSNLAREVIRRLHPGMRDPDLPARLDQWARTWPASRPAMERYLKSVFGRQRRFI